LALRAPVRTEEDLVLRPEEAGSAVQPEVRKTNLALQPETEVARGRETTLALRAAERGGEEDSEWARRAIAKRDLMIQINKRTRRTESREWGQSESEEKTKYTVKKYVLR
jgi:hypothetical protein